LSFYFCFLFFFLLDDIDSRLIELERSLDLNLKETTEYNQKKSKNALNDLPCNQLKQDLI